MKVNTLPEDLKISTTSAIQLFPYQSNNDLERTKINLTKNTISFLRKGTKEVHGDDKTVLISNQQFVLMKSGNCLMTEKVSATDKFYKSILLFFSDEVIIDFLERNDLYAIENKKHGSFTIFEYDDFIAHFVESLEKMLTLPQKIQMSLIKIKLEEIMLYLTQQHGANFLNQLIQKANPTESQLIHVVENNRLNKLSLQELAFLCNMSVSTFKRAFAKHYKTTPSKWFNGQRLEHMALLMKTQKKRPIELYEEAGYENLSNFIQAFKKQFGITPKQYQLQN